MSTELIPYLDARFRRANRRVLAVGDSRTAAISSYDPASVITYEANGYLTSARFLSRQRFDFDASRDNGGVGGDTTTMILARLPALLAANDASVIAILGETNDRGSAAMTAAQTIANWDAMEALVLGAGRTLLWLAEMPRGDTVNTGNRLSGDQLAYHFQCHRDLLGRHGRPGVFVADPWKYMALANSLTGDAIAGMLHDGLHTSLVGGFAAGKAVAEVLNQIFPAIDFLPTSNADVYAANHPKGYLNSNPMMDGSSGAVGTGGSGSLATGYTGSSGSGYGTITRAYSKVTDAVLGREVQQIVLGGTPTAASSLDLVRQSSLHGNVAAGDKLRAFCDIEWDAGLTGLYGLNLRARFLNAAATVLDARDMDGYTSSFLMPTGANSGIMLLPNIPAPATFDDLQLSVRSQHPANTACAGTIRIKSIGIRKE
jgi:hypothetical protein